MNPWQYLSFAKMKTFNASTATATFTDYGKENVQKTTKTVKTAKTVKTVKISKTVKTAATVN